MILIPTYSLSNKFSLTLKFMINIRNCYWIDIRGVDQTIGSSQSARQ